jgi:prepilin-type N-terminal cleavage/methylation domain-containing protein
MTRRDLRSGFTLVETLAALAIVAATAVVIQRGMVIARAGVDRVEATAAAEALARSLIETGLDQAAPRVGTWSGRSDGLAWTIVAEPLDLPFPPPAPPRLANRVASREAAPAQEFQNRPGGVPEEPQPEQPAAKWRPLRVTVRVETGPGKPFSVETVHLVRER